MLPEGCGLISTYFAIDGFIQGYICDFCPP